MQQHIAHGLWILALLAAAPAAWAQSRPLNLAPPVPPASAQSAAAASGSSGAFALPGTPESKGRFTFQSRTPSYQPPVPNAATKEAGRAPTMGPIWDQYGRATVSCSRTPMDRQCQ